MNSLILFNGINTLSFPFLLPFAERPKPCVAWQPSEEQAVCLPGDPITVRALCAALDVRDADRHWQSWAITASSASRKASRKPKHNLTTMHGVDQGKPLLRCSCRVRSHTWQKHWWWRRHSHSKTSAEWCLWYPPTAQVRCLLHKHTPGRFPFKHWAHTDCTTNISISTHKKRT